MRSLAASGLVLVVGCQQQDEVMKGRVAALEGRLERLDKRLGELEKQLPQALSLRDDLRDLEARLSMTERRLDTPPPPVAAAEPGAAAPAPPPPARTTSSTLPGPRAPVPPMAEANPEAARARAEAMTRLATEFRTKLEAMRDNRTALSMAEQRDQRRELSRWFRDQRRAILRGELPSSEVPGTPAQ